MRQRLFYTILFFLSGYILLAQVKTLQAVKTLHPPKIDGFINDEVWQFAPIATDFVESQPEFGDTATKKTEVKILYDDEAIYIGAHLYDDPKLIRKQLTERDNEDGKDVDLFGVVFDTYNDKQNGFAFTLTSANVQSDYKASSNQIVSSLNNNNNSSGSTTFDPSWDAVWDSKVRIVDDGWEVEMKIPYMSLRFARKDIQDWGINFFRFIRRLNEEDDWNPIDPKITGKINQCGIYRGLKNLRPPLRLSLFPYISLGYSKTPTNNGTIKDFIHDGGMDIKYGINESFTMDMTLIPDFGQTQSDNVVLNLTPYELQFNENRPFFTEGTELFNKAGIFYSRRIGRTPRLYDSVNTWASDSGYTIVKNPSLTQLYNATKFSGRTKNNLGIGFFNAVTAAETAEIIDSLGKHRTIETEPFSNYNIVVFDKALKNRSSITFTNTNVTRKAGERSANVSAIDLSLFDRNNKYNLQLGGRFSTVSASGLQGGFAADGGNDQHNGFKALTNFAKVSGIWQWSFSNAVTSNRYDPNDLGYLKSPNEILNSFNLIFQQFNPNKYFNYRNYSFTILHRYLYKPFAFRELLHRTLLTNVFKNYWDLSIDIEGNPNIQYDYFELRIDGRKLKRWPWTFFGIFAGTDSRKKLYGRLGFGDAWNIDWPNPFYLIEGQIRYRFNDKFSLNLYARREIDFGELGWAYTEPTTNEPVVGKRHVQRMESILNASYSFKARMGITVRVRHFWSIVNYTNFYHVDNGGNFSQHQIAYQTGYDDNYNALNVDAYYTWDFKPGCRLIAAYKNSIGPDASVDGTVYKTYMQNLAQSFSIPHSSQLSVKFVYFIDCNKLLKK